MELLASYKELDTWTLAQRLGMRRPQVRNILRHLEDENFVRRVGSINRLRWLEGGGRDATVPPEQVALWRITAEGMHVLRIKGSGG